MDCNKEEASKAKALAENKMQNDDFVGAQKLLLKAQRLFPDLESLPQMLAVCDVHSSAEKKINGLDNWYGILQVTRFSDNATIKNQFRKLVLLLHPDKNQFAGAEAAFKMVWEANKVLADKDKRSQYDIKYRTYSRFANQVNAKSGLQAGSVNNASDSNITNDTFLTCCQHCGHKYRYPRKYVNAHLYCSSCQRSFVAFDTGFSGVPAKSSTDQKEVRNQGACNTSVNKNVECTNAQPGSVAAEMDKKGTLKEKFKVDDGSMKNSDESSKHEKDKGKMKETVELQKPQPVDTDPETAKSKSVCEESVSRRNQPPSVNSNKNKRRKFVEEPTGSSNVEGSDIIDGKEDSKLNSRRKSSRRNQPPSVNSNKNKRRKFVEEPTGSSNVEGSNIIDGKEDSKLNNRRKSSRRTQHNSYADDPLCPLKKKPTSDVELKSERTTEKIVSGVGSSNRRDSGGSVHPCAFEEAKENVDSEYQDMSSTKDKENEGYEVPDPDFNKFELTTSCFAVNQVWSVYDPTDGMPRFYVRIEKVLDSEFKLRITWMDPLQDNKDSSIPIACGIFQDGDSDEVNDYLIFSCQMLHLHHNNNIVIYPRKGEIWAVFRGWDINWSTSSENQKRPYEYDYVEIMSDFDDEFGLGVAYLGKVEGFVSLFHREVQHGILQLQVPPNEMLRFSHKAPSFKMTGKETEGVPPGCFELDTAALPRDMFDVDGGLDSKRPNSKTSGPFPEASKVEVQVNNTLESSPSLKKRQKVHDNYTSFSKTSDDRCATHEIHSLKKSKKSVKVVDDLKLRKSPRLSATNNQTTSRSGKQPSQKKSSSNAESCGQPDGFCLSGENVTISKNPEEMITTALPRDMFDVDGGLDSKRPNSKTSGPFPEASKVEVQVNNTLESSPSLKKRQKVHENYTSFSKESDDRCASHEINSLKKSKKSVKVVDDLKLRKSPRLSATNNQTTSRSGKQPSEKKSSSNAESCGQPDGFCLSGEKVTISKNPEKMITTDSSSIRKSPRDIQKPTGNSKENERIGESLSQSRGNSLRSQRPVCRNSKD